MQVKVLRCLEATPAPTPLTKRICKLDPSDTELVVAAQSGDKDSLERLLEIHKPYIFGLINKFMLEQQDSSDFAQEVSIRVWRYIKKLQNPKAFRGWLRRIVSNVVYDELRRRPKQAIVSIDAPWRDDDGEETNYLQIPDSAACPDELYERKECYRAIQLGLAALPEKARTMIVLRELQGLSYSEISTVTKTELGTVKSRIARARKRLQVQLLPYIDAA